MLQMSNNASEMEFVLLLCLVGAITGSASALPDRYIKAVDWLSRYGYLPPPDPRTSKLQTKEGIEKAIRVMQRFGGVQETGELDSATLKLMVTPRCSIPDIVGSEDKLKRRRRKRYALTGLKWHKTDLTWRVHSYPSSSTSRNLPDQTVDHILTRAFKAWSDAAPLSFRQLSDNKGATAGGDIKVSFSRSLHDDGYPFDGQGGTLAHAFFPGRDEVAGDTHFDDDEIWSYGGTSGTTDLFTVAVHEFGHALGLGHSSTDPSIMRPYYQGPVKDILQFKLDPDDRQAIQQLYGVRNSGPPGGDPHLPHLPRPPQPRPTENPRYEPSLNERCNGVFDAVADFRGEIFFFKGIYFWRTKQDGSLHSLNPALIKNFWTGLPRRTNKIDAVYERKSDSRIIFFIGSQYWVFQDRQAMREYPRPLSDWGMRTKSGVPVDRVDAAFVWAHNGKTYLFSGDEFWRFDENLKNGEVTQQLEPDYPRNISLWKGVPSPIDDVISLGGDAHFFKDNQYWTLKNGELDQGQVSPKNIGVDWLRCPAPPPPIPPANPRNPNDCICEVKNSSASPLRSSWLILLLFLLVFIIGK